MPAYGLGPSVPKGPEVGSGNVCGGRRWASGCHEVLIGPERRSGRNQDGEDAAQFEMAMISIRDRPSSQHRGPGG